MTRLFLFDGTALAYRAQFAMQRWGLSTPEGKPVGATYGFTMTLRRILEQEAPERIAVAFDPPGDSFRHRMYGEYKATRQKMPEDLIVQQEWLRKVVRAHGIPIFEVPGYEADDVIGTLSRQASKKGWEVLIVSGDKDMMQLVDERVQLYNVFRPDAQLVLESFAAVKEKFGTTPEHVIDVLAIMGDSSDNVPGVTGIGEKGAIKLIEEFGSIPNLLANLDKVKGKARENIARDKDLLLLSLDLVTIRDDVPLDPGLDTLRPPEPDLNALVALLRELGFQSLLKKVTPDAPHHSGGEDHRGQPLPCSPQVTTLPASVGQQQSFWSRHSFELFMLFLLSPAILGGVWASTGWQLFRWLCVLACGVWALVMAALIISVVGAAIFGGEVGSQYGGYPPIRFRGIVNWFRD